MCEGTYTQTIKVWFVLLFLGDGSSFWSSRLSMNVWSQWRWQSRFWSGSLCCGRRDGPHEEVLAVRTRLVVQTKRREVLAEWLVARATQQRELRRESESMVRAELEVALAAVEPSMAARRLERKLRSSTSERALEQSQASCCSGQRRICVSIPGHWRCVCTCG
jgi:hypothetical protein